jgi:hypothetical protein
MPLKKWGNARLIPLRFTIVQIVRHMRELSDIHERKLQQSVIPLEKKNSNLFVTDFFHAKV